VVVQEEEGIDLVDEAAGQRALRDEVADIVAHRGVQAVDGSCGHGEVLLWFVGPNDTPKATCRAHTPVLDFLRFCNHRV
jgi:hypothetical protein